MKALMLRSTLMVGCLGAALLAAPSPSHAGCCLFEKWFGSQTPGATTANYCCAPVVANYVPQTSYRAQVVNVPVTTYRPCMSCDPCTGCPVTVMMPTTCVMQQTRMVPYTTYRLQYANACQRPCATCPTTMTYARPACSSCATAYAAPATMMAAPATPGCSSCGGGANVAPALPSAGGSVSTFAAPGSTVSGYMPSDISPNDSYSYGYGSAGTPIDSSPAMNGAPTQAPAEGGRQKTFDESHDALKQPVITNPPIQDSEKESGPSLNGASPPTNSTSIPRIINPENRTTMLPGRALWSPSQATRSELNPVEPFVPAAQSRPVETDDGWRASSR